MTAVFRKAIRKIKGSRYGSFLSRAGILMLFIFGTDAAGQTGWSVYSSIQMTEGKYLYDKSLRNYYLNLGLKYKSRDFYISLSAPLIAQNNDRLSQTGGMVLPNGHSSASNGQSGGGHMGSANPNHMSGGQTFSYGMGDVYLYGEYTLLSPYRNFAEVALAAQVKAPIAGTLHNFGTGQFDYFGGLAIRKRIHRWIVFADAGYYVLGDGPEIDYQNSVSYGLGGGHFFENGKYSVSMYYQGFTEIIKGYEGPRQISMGIFYRVNSKILFSVLGAGGLSKTSPDYALTSGLDYYL